MCSCSSEREERLRRASLPLPGCPAGSLQRKDTENDQRIKHAESDAVNTNMSADDEWKTLWVIIRQSLEMQVDE